MSDFPWRWRVGQKLGRTLYYGDILHGLLDSSAIAQRIADAMNAVTGGRASVPPNDATESIVVCTVGDWVVERGVFDLATCPACGFQFHACHKDRAGTYSCPNCQPSSQAELRWLQARLFVARALITTAGSSPVDAEGWIERATSWLEESDLFARVPISREEQERTIREGLADREAMLTDMGMTFTVTEPDAPRRSEAQGEQTMTADAFESWMKTGRNPGDDHSTSQSFQKVANELKAVVEVPGERVNLEWMYDPPEMHKGKKVFSCVLATVYPIELNDGRTFTAEENAEAIRAALVGRDSEAVPANPYPDSKWQGISKFAEPCTAEARPWANEAANTIRLIRAACDQGASTARIIGILDETDIGTIGWTGDCREGSG